ncbi:MAG: MlaD family protein [Nitrospinota bacterium]
MAGTGKYRSAEVKVGIFVVLGLLLFLAFVFFVTGTRWGQKVDVYRVRFRNVAGLEVGSSVRLAGLKVGRVEEIAIARDDPSLMEAVVHIKPGTPVREGARASITAIGLTGEMYLELSLGRREAALLPPGSTLVGEEAASFQDLLNEWRDVASRTGRILEELGGSLVSLVGRSRELTEGLDESLRNITASAEELVENLNAVFDEQRRQELQSIIGGVDKTVKETSALMRKLNLLLSEKNQQELDTFLTRSNQLLESLDQEMTATLRQIREGAGKLEGALRGDVQRTSQAFRRVAFRADRLLSANAKDLRQLIKNFRETSDRTRGLLVKLEGSLPEKGELRETLLSIRQALDQARVLAAHIDQTVEGNREDIAIIVQNMREASQNISEFSRILRERPSSIILAPVGRRKEIPGE